MEVCRADTTQQDNYLDNLKYSIAPVSRCHNIIDVSALRNFHTLDLNHCNITDVSMLGNVHTLHLIGCYKITDTIALENVYN